MRQILFIIVFATVVIFSKPVSGQDKAIPIEGYVAIEGDFSNKVKPEEVKNHAVREELIKKLDQEVVGQSQAKSIIIDSIHEHLFRLPSSKELGFSLIFGPKNLGTSTMIETAAEVLRSSSIIKELIVVNPVLLLNDDISELKNLLKNTEQSMIYFRDIDEVSTQAKAYLDHFFATGSESGNKGNIYIASTTRGQSLIEKYVVQIDEIRAKSAPIGYSTATDSEKAKAALKEAQETAEIKKYYLKNMNFESMKNALDAGQFPSLLLTHVKRVAPVLPSNQEDFLSVFYKVFKNNIRVFNKSAQGLPKSAKIMFDKRDLNLIFSDALYIYRTNITYLEASNFAQKILEEAMTIVRSVGSKGETYLMKYNPQQGYFTVYCPTRIKKAPEGKTVNGGIE